MTSKNTTNSHAPYTLFSHGELRRVPRFLLNEDGSLSDDLNPEWVELKNRYRAIEVAEIETLLAELDELSDSKTTEEPVVDTPKAPVHHTAAATPDKSVEIDPILVKVDGIQTATLPNDTAREPKKPIATTVPVMSEPQKRETDLASLSTDELLKLQKSLFSNDFTYTDTERALNRGIAVELTKRDISPIERNFPKYDPVACKNPAISAYMVDMQAFDPLWIWHTHKGHQTNSEALNGMFADIFTGDQFDWEKACKIAIGEYYDAKTKKIKNLTTPTKIKYLRLPECWQEELAVLRSDAIRQQQDEAKNKARREREKLDALKVRTIDIQHRLQAYRDNHSRRTSLNVEVYTNVWLALEISKGSRTYLADATRKYNELTGESISKSLMQRRIDYLEKALKR
jgi:hypothetical protein